MNLDRDPLNMAAILALPPLAPLAAPQRVAFRVDGVLFSLDEMLLSNADDENFCDWARRAAPGDVFPAVVSCEAVAS